VDLDLGITTKKLGFYFLVMCLQEQYYKSVLSSSFKSI
jgi:hypothetical protein